MTMVRATPAHAALLAAVHATAFPLAGRWPADAFAAQLRLPGVFGLIDAAGGAILTRVVADEAEILTLAVAPEARRNGLGRALLAAAMSDAHRAGAATMFLEVAASNVAALALYYHADFQEIGRRRRYYEDGGDALVLRARLPCGSTGA